jgi:protein KRI1
VKLVGQIIIKLAITPPIILNLDSNFSQSFYPTMGPAKKDLFDDNASSSSDSSSSSDDSSSSDSSSTTPTKKKNITSITKKNENSNNADDGGEDEDLRLTVNKKFATKYQNRKEREELIQIRQRKGGDDGRGGGGDSSESDSSDEEEDEVGELFTPSVNVQFLKTIKALRKKDDKIYDPNTQFFDNNVADDDNKNDGDDEDESKTEKKQKPKRYKDVVREQILEQMEDEENEGGKNKTNMNVDVSDDHRSKLGYDEQQNKLRKAFLTESSGKDEKADGESDDDDDEWMVVKKKAPEQDLNQLEKEATEQLKEIEDLSNNNSNKKKGDNTFKDPRGEVEDGEKFLLDFIQNKKWIDKNDLDRGRYDDKFENENNESGDESSLDDVDRADDYESQYNFRFEQATQGATTNSGANLSVQTYARGQTMNTVRRTDTTRKDKREARKERKVAERKAKEEQLKRLKNAKKQEMNQKLSKVKSVIGGIEENAIDEAQIMQMLEGDYDPEKFEKAMEEAYGDEFYQKEDNEWKTDVDVRETLKGDDEGEDLVGQDDVNGGMYDNVQEEGEGEVNENAMEEEEEYYDESAEWDDNNNDAYDGSHDETKLEKKLKTKMQDELYKLDYEDIVAGMPTRFKYRQVESNDYGLTTQEILFARDTTLKQFVSLKKMAPYNEQDEFNAGSKKRRKFREMLKKDLEADQPAPKEESQEDDAKNSGEAAAEEVEEPKKKRRRLKKGKKRSKDDTLVPTSTELSEKSEVTKADAKSSLNDDEVGNSKETKKRRRKKSGKKADKDTNDEGIVEKLDSNHKEADENKNKVTESGDWKGNSESVPDCEEEKQKKKKKKKKKDKNGTKGSVAGMSKSRLASYGL